MPQGGKANGDPARGRDARTILTEVLMTRMLRIAALIGTAAWLCPAAASAQTVGDKAWIEGSWFLPKVSSEIQVSRTGSTTPGTEIDLESDLGLDDREGLPAISAGGRITRNIVVVADYYAIGRDATKTLDRTIVVEDVTYPVNASVTTGFDSDIYRLTVGYSFYHKDNVEIGGAIGLHATDFAVSISGTGSVGGGAPVGGTVRRQEFLAPLPTLGLYGSVEITEGLTLSGRIDYMSLKVGDFDGSLTNTQAALAYQLMDNVAIGAMYRLVDYRVDVEKPRFTGRFEYEFKGPAIFLRARI